MDDATGLIKTTPVNLLTRSEEFDNASWTKYAVTVTSNAISSPNNEVTAEKLIATSTSAEHFIQNSSPQTSLNKYYTYSVHCKADELSSIVINVSASRLFATFDLASGTVITSSSNGTDFDNQSGAITSPVSYTHLRAHKT